MKIYNLKKLSIPKVAVLATGLAAGVMVVTINPSPAQAFPSQTQACTGCHAAGGSVTATPSNAALAPGAAYTVALAFTGGAGGSVGYWISGEGGNVNGSSTTAAMTAPAAAGTYTYTVWMRDDVTSSTTYSITVGVAPTTPPVTTPPVTTPPTTEPPVTTPPTTPVSTASIRSLSVRHGTVGTKVKIRGTNFGTAGIVQFGTVTATASSWSGNAIVVTVPAKSAVSVQSESEVRVPIWYRHVERVAVTVTPKDAAASNAIMFRLDADIRGGHGHGHGDHFGHDGR